MYTLVLVVIITSYSYTFVVCVFVSLCYELFLIQSKTCFGHTVLIGYAPSYYNDEELFIFQLYKYSVGSIYFYHFSNTNSSYHIWVTIIIKSYLLYFPSPSKYRHEGIP